MNRQKEKSTNSEGAPSRDGVTAITRRDFIKVTGAIIMVAGTGGCKIFKADESQRPTLRAEPTRLSSSQAQDKANTPTPANTPMSAHTPTPANTLAPTNTPAPTHTPETGQILVPPDGIPPADGYLLVDIEKCQGCASCMLACSLIHEGVESLSLSRIQIMQDSFESFPGDLTIEQCRQCVDPACVKVCPTGALQANAEYGNVRVVDKEKCIGCGLCYGACPFTPSRAFLAADQAYHDQAKSRKCDLCANAPYHWDEAGGGPDGKQACVAVCPVGAIVFAKEIPDQDGDGGYKVNLRDDVWAILGYPTS